MALAHAVAGATRPSQVITWTRDDGTAEDLTGATITGKIRSLADGTTRDIAEASDNLGIAALARPVEKWYLAWPRWMEV